MPEINAHLKALGIDVGASAMSEDEPEEEAKPQKRVKAKKGEKANIEATSDEGDN
jgi:hypothetical protein